MKIFAREPMGLVTTLVFPLVIFLALGRMLGAGRVDTSPPPFNVAILAALTIVVSAVISLIAIISIYRESGVLKRLRATPLSPVTILSAQVGIKLVFSIISLALLVLAGRRLLPGALDVNLISFTAALLLSTVSILSLGFVIASVVPTARFAQPIGAAFLDPMIAISGLFFPLEQLPTGLRVVAQALPTTHAVSLMQGVWDGAGWGPHLDSVLALIAVLAVCLAISTKAFRWE